MRQLSFIEQVSQTRKRQHLCRERAHFSYLPELRWMNNGGYKETLAGSYEHGCTGEHFYRLTLLSQSCMLLAFRNDVFTAGAEVHSDEALLRFLSVHHFPLPG